MVDAGGSRRAATAAQFWMRSLYSSRHSGQIWQWSSLSNNSILNLDRSAPVGTVPPFLGLKLCS